MDRKGALPTKGTTLAALLLDVATNMYECHCAKVQHDLQQQAIAAAAAADHTSSNNLISPSDTEASDVLSPEPSATAMKSPMSDSVFATSHSTSSATSGVVTAAPATGASRDATRAMQMGVTESDLTYAYRLLRHLIDAVTSTKECCEVAACDSARKLFDGPLRRLAPQDHSLALYCCALVSNLCAFQESRVILSSSARAMFELTLANATQFVTERRLVHLSLMALSNLAPCDALDLDATHCERIVHLLMPNYSEAAVVEAWCCALCCLTAHHANLAAELLRLGVFDILGRLLLFFGDDSRVVSRGLQLMSNLHNFGANGE